MAAARSTTASRSPAAVDCATFDPFADASTVSRAGPLTVGDLAPGTIKSQCMIHPWMRATVDVRASGNRGGRG